MDITFGGIYLWMPRPVSGGRGSKFRGKHPARGMGEGLQNQHAGEGWSGVGRRGENGKKGTT